MVKKYNTRSTSNTYSILSTPDKNPPATIITATSQMTASNENSHENQNKTASHNSHYLKKTNDQAGSVHLMSSKKTLIEKHARKKARQAHTRRTLRRLKEDDDLFLDQCIERVEDEKTANAKRNNNKNGNWKLVVKGYNNNKPKPLQTARNTIYNISTTVRQAMSSSNKVRFASNIATVCTYNKMNKPKVLWVTYDSGEQTIITSKKKIEEQPACQSYAIQQNE